MIKIINEDKITSRLEVTGSMSQDEQHKRNGINHSLDVMTDRGINTEDEVRNYLLRCVYPEDEGFLTTGVDLTYDEALNFYNELKGINYN